MTYLSVKETAQKLGVTTARVYQYIGEHRLKSEKVGTHTLIKTEDLIAFMQEPRPNGRYLKPRTPRRLKEYIDKAIASGCPCDTCKDLRSVYNGSHGTDSAATVESGVSTAPSGEPDAGRNSTLV